MAKRDDGGRRGREPDTPKNGWHQLRDAIEMSNLTPADCAVFKAYLDSADFKTGAGPGEYTPTEQRIRAKTKLSLRQVKYSKDHLALHSWIAAKRIGRKLQVEVRAGRDCDCAGRVHARRKGATKGAVVAPIKGATVAPIQVQPIGATPQVNDHIDSEAMRGVREEGRMKPNTWPPVRIPGVRGDIIPTDPATRDALRVLVDGLGPVTIIEAIGRVGEPA